MCPNCGTAEVDWGMLGSDTIGSTILGYHSLHSEIHDYQADADQGESGGSDADWDWADPDLPHVVPGPDPLETGEMGEVAEDSELSRPEPDNGDAPREGDTDDRDDEEQRVRAFAAVAQSVPRQALPATVVTSAPRVHAEAIPNPLS